LGSTDKWGAPPSLETEAMARRWRLALEGNSLVVVEVAFSSVDVGRDRSDRRAKIAPGKRGWLWLAAPRPPARRIRFELPLGAKQLRPVVCQCEDTTAMATRALERVRSKRAATATAGDFIPIALSGPETVASRKPEGCSSLFGDSDGHFPRQGPGTLRMAQLFLNQLSFFRHRARTRSPFADAVGNPHLSPNQSQGTSLGK